MGGFTVFRKSNGEIVVNGYAPDGEEDAQLIDTTNNDIINDQWANIETQYVTGYPTTPVISTRPLLSTVATWNKTTITADGSDSAILGSGLPNPSTVTIISSVEGVAEDSGTCTDGSVSITSSDVGTITVIVESFPYQTQTTTITCEAP